MTSSLKESCPKRKEWTNSTPRSLLKSRTHSLAPRNPEHNLLGVHKKRKLQRNTIKAILVREENIVERLVWLEKASYPVLPPASFLVANILWHLICCNPVGNRDIVD